MKYFRLSLLLIMLSLVVVSPARSDEWSVDSTTIALYHFDDLTDAGPNSFDLSMEGNAELSDDNLGWMENPSGKALKISGLGDEATVLIPDGYVLQETSARQLTFEAWFYVVSYKAYGIENEQILTLYQAWDSSLEVRDGKWNSPHVPTVRSGNTTVVTDDEWEQAVSLNQWHFLRITYENGQVNVYVDQALISTSTVLLNPGRTNDWALILGNFEGYIDEVRISNVIRTEAPPVTLPGNQPPRVDAGQDLEIYVDQSSLLQGEATDDGFDNSDLYTIWSKTSGPGQASFESSEALETEVYFSEIGSYILRLLVDDGEFSVYDEVTVSVVERPDPNTTPFSIVILPDTQAYSDYFPEKFISQTRWIAENVDTENVKIVLHEGDVVNHVDDPLEWESAVSAMALLDGNAPYVISVGNHDYAESRDSSALNAAFPLSRYTAMTTFGGVFEEGNLENSYHMFSAGGVDFLVLALEFGPRDEVLSWADEILSNYPNRRAIILTHAYLNGDGTRLDDGDPYNPHFYSLSGTVNDGEELWQNLIRKHANIDFVFCGHVRGVDQTGCAHAYSTDVGDSGNLVHQIVANYQDCYNGGDGYLRIITFDPVARSASVYTYSPYLDAYLTDSLNEFVIQDLPFFEGGDVENQAPSVDAGAYGNITVSETLSLSGTVSDDGLLYETVVTQWSLESGPGTASFSDPTNPVTDVTFSSEGTYTLQLSAYDGEFQATDMVTISVTISVGDTEDEFSPDNETIALYHFDDLTDAGPNGLDLTMAGSGELTDENLGWMGTSHGKALKINDLGDQVTIAIPDSLIMPGSSPSTLSFEARFYPVSYKAYGVGNYQILTLYQSWDSSLEVRDGKWNNPSVPSVRSGQTTVLTDDLWEETVALNEWHSLRVTFDGGTVRIYMDGQAVQSVAATVNAGRTNDWILTLGNFEGYVDEVRVSSVLR